MLKAKARLAKQTAGVAQAVRLRQHAATTAVAPMTGARPRIILGEIADV
jgi:hypothetical protein